MTLARDRTKPALHGGLSTIEYFTFGFGTMIGVGWVVLMDDWLSRGGPGGGMLGFLIGGVFLFSVAPTHRRLVARLPRCRAQDADTPGGLSPPPRLPTRRDLVLALPVLGPA